MAEEFRIRAAEPSDIDSLVSLEVRAWSRRGAPILSPLDLEGWLSENSPFFLIAEDDNQVCGYYFGRQVDFELTHVDLFLSPDRATGRGFSDHPHNPFAGDVYGISVATLTPGAGHALNIAVHALLTEMRTRYFIGFTRLSGFAFFARQAGLDNSSDSDLRAACLWYAQETAELLGLEAWEQTPPKSALSLPHLRRPDPVMRFHTHGIKAALLGILPNYMPDPASLNFGALLISNWSNSRVAP